MNGKDLKFKLKVLNVNFSKLSSALGYQSDQQLHGKLKSKDVKSGLIENIACVLGKSITEMYEEDVPVTSRKAIVQASIKAVNSPNAIDDLMRTIEKQQQTIEKQQQTIDRLTKMLDRTR